MLLHTTNIEQMLLNTTPNPNPTPTFPPPEMSLIRAGCCAIDQFHGDRVPPEHSLGPSTNCGRCNAVRLDGESNGFCCTPKTYPLLQGKEVQPVPEELINIFDNPNNKLIIRKLNQAHAFTSLGTTKVDQQLANATNGVYTFRVQGQMHHLMSQGLLPQQDDRPTYGQIYFHESGQQANERHRLMNDLPLNLLTALAHILENHNPFVHLYRLANEVMTDDSAPKILRFKQSSRNYNAGTHNRPTATEVAAIIDINDLSDEGGNIDRHVILHSRSTGLQRISTTDGHFDPLSYPLFFPHGDVGWSPYITGNGKTGRSSAREFYAYKLMIRPNMQNVLHHGTSRDTPFLFLNQEFTDQRSGHGLLVLLY